MATAKKKQQKRAKKPAAAAPSAGEMPPRPMGITTWRLYIDQMHALQRLALERKISSQAPGRADASAILREIVDEFLKGNSRG